MSHLIDKDAIVAEITKRYDEYVSSILKHYDACKEAKAQELGKILTILETLEVKESNEIAEAFARIIRANLTGIDKDIQYKFEQLYNEITGEKMYQGYND